MSRRSRFSLRPAQRTLPRARRLLREKKEGIAPGVSLAGCIAAESDDCCRRELELKRRLPTMPRINFRSAILGSTALAIGVILSSAAFAEDVHALTIESWRND